MASNMNQQERHALQQLCRMFSVSEEAAAPNEAHALLMLTALYSNLSINDSHERRRNRDKILQETHREWGNSRFFSQVQGAIALTMVQRDWFGRRASNRQLIDKYEVLVAIAVILEILGAGDLVGMVKGSVAKGLEDPIKDNSRRGIKKGIEAASRRFVLGGGSGVLEAVAIRFGIALGPWALAVRAVGIAAYLAILGEMDSISKEMQLRHNLGRASSAEVEAVSADTLSAHVLSTFQKAWDRPPQ